MGSILDTICTILGKTFDSVCADLKEEFPSAYACFSKEGEEPDDTSEGDSSLQGENGTENSPAVEAKPVELEGDAIKSEYLTFSQRAPEASGILKDNSLIKNLIEAISLDPTADSSRRYFNEIHQYPSDPHLTMGFPHYANENLTKMFLKMPAPIKKRLTMELSELLLADEEYLAQFKKDYKDLFNEKIPDDVTDLSGFINKFFSADGILKEGISKTILTKKHDGICLWADGRILEYAKDHIFSQYIYTPDSLQNYDLNIFSYNLDSSQAAIDAEGGYIEVSKETYSKNKNGAFRKTADGNGTHRKVRNLNVYVSSKDCVKESGGERWFVSRMNASVKKITLNLKTYALDNDQAKEDEYGNYMEVSEDLYVKTKKGYEISPDGTYRKVNGLSVYVSDDSCKQLGFNHYIKLLRGANLFPGYDKKNGYWFNDLMPSVMLLRGVAEWQLFLWTSSILKNASSVSGSYGLDKHIGAQASMTSWANSGGMGVNSVGRVISGVKDARMKFSINLFTYKIEGIKAVMSEDGSYMEVSSETYSLDKKKNHVLSENGEGDFRKVLGSEKYVAKSSCINASGRLFVNWKDNNELGNLNRNILTYSVQDSNAVIDANGVFVKVSDITYNKKGKQDDKGTYRKVLGTDKYVTSTKSLQFEMANDGFYISKTLKELKTVNTNCMTYDLDLSSAKASKDLSGDYLKADSQYFKEIIVKIDGKEAYRYYLPSVEDEEKTHLLIPSANVYLPKEQYLELSQEHFILYKRNNNLSSVTINLEAFKKAITGNFIPDENGNFVLTEDTVYVYNEKKKSYKESGVDEATHRKIKGTNVYVPKGNCQQDPISQTWYVPFRAGVSKVPSKTDKDAYEAYLNDLSALRIWLYYNMTRFEKKKDKDFRGRQRNIYQKWFKESWGDLPSFDSNLEASMMDGQKYSIVPERYAYTGKSMSTKERPFVWDTIKDEMNLEYEPLLKMP